MAYNLGVIYGTPAGAGVYNIDLTATNAAGTAHGTLTLTVTETSVQIPVITSPTTAIAIASEPFSYQITATNSPDRFSADGYLPGLSVAFLTGILSGTFTDLGVHDFDLSATNAAGTGHGTLSLTLVATDSYAAWALTAGLSGAAADPLADPDADGLNNLLEFALNTNPLEPSAGQAPAFAIEPGTRALVLTHRRSKTANVVWAYQVSTDLINWTVALPTTSVVSADVDGDGQTELIRAVLSPIPGDTRRFIRLAVTAP